MLNYELESSEKEYELLDAEYHGETGMLNPFPGLRPFGVDECHLFFGREGQVDEILVKLSENRFITLLGYSGSGKSSLMYCGIIPILYGGFMTDSGADWNIVVTRPGYSPLDNLAESLIQQDPEYANASEGDRLIKKTIASAILRGGSSGLIDIARQYKRLTGDNLLIMVDQFEEIFRYKESSSEAADEAAVFIKLLLEAVESDDVPIYVAITMRSDFIGHSAHYPDLTNLINKSNYVIPQMTREQKRMAIEGPVAVGGGRMASRLVKRLLKEIGDNQDQLPIMQHALMRTWDYWVDNREKGEELDFRHYNAVGKISEALSQHADEAYNQLSANHKRVTEIIFKNLTEKGTDNYGIRRPSTIREIARVADVDESIIIEVVEHFRQPGLSLLMPPSHIELYSDSIVEISHESLMRIWTRLKNWVDEENESAKMYLRISEAAALYQIGRTGLWRPPDLQLALQWQKKQKPTRFWAQRYDDTFERANVFLDTSRITYESEQESQELLQKKMLRRARGFAAILGVAAIIAIVFGILSLERTIDANRQRVLADQAKVVAEAATEQANIEKANADIAREAAVISAQEAIDAKADTDRALVQVQNSLVQVTAARNAEAIARRNAEKQTVIAQDATKDANAQRDRAEQLVIEKNNLYLLSISGALAGKSLQERDNDLRALMAQQAYNYNIEYGRQEFDKYIYDALYYSLRAFGGEDYNMFLGHKGAIKSVVFGNENQFFSTGSGGRILAWDLADNQQLPVEIGSQNLDQPNRDLIVSPDKKWLLSTSDSAAMKLFSLGDLTKAPVIIRGHKGFVRDAQFMPDNSGIVSVGSDNSIMFYDFNRSRLLKQLQYSIHTIDIAPSGDYIYGGTANGSLVKIAISDMSETELYTLEGQSRIAGLDISGDGKWVAFGGEAGYVVLYDLINEELVQELYGHTARVNDVAFSNNGRRLATASWDGTIQIWNMENLDDLPYYLKDNGESFAWDLTFSPNDDFLIVGTKDGKIKKWATENGTMASQICQLISRNMSKEEWDRYVNEDVDYQKTCNNLPTGENSL